MIAGPQRGDVRADVNDDAGAFVTRIAGKSPSRSAPERVNPSRVADAGRPDSDQNLTPCLEPSKSTLSMDIGFAGAKATAALSFDSIPCYRLLTTNIIKLLCDLMPVRSELVRDLALQRYEC